jgi:hypothetical protein
MSLGGQVKNALAVAFLIVCTTLGLAWQPAHQPESKADVQMEKHTGGALHAGDSVSFTLKLNAPLPKGAHFIMRISPTNVDQQVDLGSGDALDESRTKFRVTGKLPDEAVPGKWHIAVIYLFLPGSNWTSNTLKPNDLTFEVEGKQITIPTTADVSLDK